MLSTTLPRSLLPSFALKLTNTSLDWLFYDIQNLTRKEFLLLTEERTLEGKILVVYPNHKDPKTTDVEQDCGVIPRSNYAALQAAKGKPLTRFSIAGVGSSDVGAASFARTVANIYNEPVGAIVAGYGMSDLMLEALEGWFILGQANRFAAYNLYLAQTAYANAFSFSAAAQNEPNYSVSERSPDTLTLEKMLFDDKRQIESITTHSKGCLSMAMAMQNVFKSDNTDAKERAMNIDLVTVGSVVALPAQVTKIRQYLGAMDGFGAINSRLKVDFHPVQFASHHLNRSVPFNLKLAEAMATSYRTGMID
jgi:hypothetical protein